VFDLIFLTLFQTFRAREVFPAGRVKSSGHASASTVEQAARAVALKTFSCLRRKIALLAELSPF
jgi:hypothetical protein